MAAALDEAAVRTAHADRLVAHREVRWDAQQEIVVAEEQQRLGAIVLSARRIADAGEAGRTAMMAGIRRLGLGCLPWTDTARQWQARVESLRAWQPEGAWPDVSDEALLAVGFIFTVHFFNTHFRLDKFPMDTVIFSGHISKAEMLTERRRWYDRLVASGKLEQHRVIHTDWAARRTLYKTLGFIFVGIGLLLLALMIYALLSRLGH